MMSSGEESNREEELAIVNLENVKRISETYKPNKGKGKNKKGKIPKSVVQEIWKDRLSPRFYSRLMSVMFPEDSNEVSFLSFYTIYKNLAEPETEVMFRALTIYHIATIHEPPFNYEQANEYPNASYKAIKDYICDVITSYLHAIIHINMKEAHSWLDLRASNTLIDGNLVASYMLKDLETHRNEVSIGSLEIWLEKNEMYYTVSEQLYLFLFGVISHANVKPLIPLPVVQTGRATKTLLALPDVLLLNSKLPKRAQRWTLAYMLDSRSQNWETFKQAICGRGQTIIVIQDANGDIFGMYGSHKWFPSEGFFGNDECFLFTLKPDVNIYEGSGRDNNFQLFTESGIGMGGTADRPGLFIQSDTMKGSTSLACSTFREFWPLGRELEFKITQLEIWAVEGNKEAQEEVEQDVGKLISNTQYMRMGGDEMYMYNEERKLKLPRSNQPKEVADIAFDKTPEVTAMGTCGPVICCGECASYQPKYGPSCNQRRVCCSKRCKKKIEEPCSLNNPRGEGDGYKEVQTLQRYPRQEDERRQCRHKYSEDEVKVKQGNRIQRISCDARQKHGAAAGFIHPSLAAEENERNAREAKDTKALSPPSTIISKSNRSKTSKKYRSSFERDPPSWKSNSPTFNVTHNKTQVGESRLMKPTCKLYKHENKCLCVTKTYCACTPQETLSGKSKKQYSVRTNYTKKEKIGPEENMSNKNTSTKTAKNNTNTSEQGCDSVRTYACLPRSKDFTAESSSTVFIELNSSCPDEKKKPAGLSEYNSTVSETSRLGNKLKVSPIEKRAEPSKKDEQPVSEAYYRTQNVKSESNSKMKEKVYEGKGRQEDKTPTFFIQATYSAQNIQENTKFSLQELMQNELDCHCSSSSDCDAVEKRNKKCDPASMCSCEAKVSNYLTKMNRTDIPDVPLSEISSSVCSCILDNKNKNTAQSSINSSKKENQNFNKSRKKSDGSSYSVFENDEQPKKTQAEILNTFFALKKETQLHARSRRASRTHKFPSDHSNKQPSPVPPTCLRCKTLVSRDGCQCEAQPISTKVGHTLLETSRLLQKELVKNSSTMKNDGNRRSVVIDTEALSFDDSKLRDKDSLKSESTSSRIIRESSQYSDIKAGQTKSCKTSCKCSLARSYFPVFPEDLIKEGGISEDCDCASYNNLRFPIIVETPPERSPEPSEKSHTTMEPDQANKQTEEQEIKDKDCECNDNDNTIIILNVSKCNAVETVQKIVQQLEEKTGENSNPNVKSLVLKCKDFAESKASTLHYSPCTSKSGAEREFLRQHIDKILKGKSQVTPPEPDQEEQP